VSLLVKRHQQIADECRKYLNAHRIFCTAEELLDLQMLLDPFEKKLDCPAFFVALANFPGARRKVIGRQNERRWFVGSHNRDTAKWSVEVFVESPPRQGSFL